MSERREFEQARQALSSAHERNGSLCDPFLTVLPISGASVSVLSGQIGQATLCSSSTIAARLDELQFDLGEGPCWEALATRKPVLTSDLQSGSHGAWPVFAEAARSDRIAANVGSMFAFPLVVGSLEIGAIDLYTLQPGELSQAEVSDASALAGIAAWQVLRRILDDQADELANVDTSYTSRREVHQATGMVLVQLGVSAADAELLLRAHAFANGRSVSDVAMDVVARRLDFSTTMGDSA